MAGGPSTPALVAAVGSAGGLGFLAGGYQSPGALAEQIAELPTAMPFGVNLFVPGPVGDAASIAAYRSSLVGRYPVEPGEPRWDDDDWDAKLSVVEGVPVVSFAFGLPSRGVIEQLRRSGSQVFVTVTTADEAEEAGDVDGLVLQGVEAGAHRGGWTDGTQLSLTALLASTRTDLPRWAAGGLGSRSDVARVLEQGADAAVLGTAFLLCPEAGTNATHREALRDRGFASTALTRAFTGKWARGLVNDFLREHPDAPAGYPEIHHVTRPIRQAAAASGDAQSLHLWAGEGWREARAIPAADLVRSLSVP
ncbi:MAG: 2-nitropropane dioxygenase [Frankiales bacterium]|nr:2-nitropropane dioxygenase [Frankiales bacterium]